MKLLVISDTHGALQKLEEIIRAEASCELLLFLGDGCADLRRIDRHGMGFVAVAGNCDGYSCTDPQEMHFELGGVMFFITHGHKYQAKADDSLLYYRAKQLGARIVCYGHTHTAETHERGGILMMNPGSAGRSIPTSYGVIEVDEGSILRAELKSLPLGGVY